MLRSRKVRGILLRAFPFLWRCVGRQSGVEQKFQAVAVSWGKVEAVS